MGLGGNIFQSRGGNTVEISVNDNRVLIGVGSDNILNAMRNAESYMRIEEHQ